MCVPPVWCVWSCLMVQSQSLDLVLLIPSGVSMQSGQSWQFEEVKYLAQERRGNAWN